MEFTAFDLADNRAAVRRANLTKALYEARIIEVFAEFRRLGIEPILIKGWAIARFYPFDKSRVSNDIDLCVGNPDFEKSKRLVERLNLKKPRVDLHKAVKNLDKVEFADLFEKSKLIETAGTTIRVLSDEDNLRIACVHWLNDGGAKREKLWDVYYLVQNRSPNFDWNRCLDAAGKIRRNWIVCTIAIAQRELSLNVVGTPFETEITQGAVVPKWLSDALQKEWNDPVKLGIISQSQSWRTFVEQLRKRFPPNPILASIDVEAPFDDTPRLRYQIADIFHRAYQSANRIAANVWQKR